MCSVINAIDRTTPNRQTDGAVMFFVGTDLARVVLLVLVPGITLFLIP